MDNLERTIIVKDKNDNNMEGQIIFTFEANGDNFVLYELNEEAFAAKVNEEGTLTPVMEDEWKLVEKIYNEYMEDMESKDE